MALQGTDLFVVQSQADGELYKLRLDSLIAEVEGGDGVTFRGAVDLNNPPASSGVILPGRTVTSIWLRAMLQPLIVAG